MPYAPSGSNRTKYIYKECKKLKENHPTIRQYTAKILTSQKKSQTTKVYKVSSGLETRIKQME
jgi:hypothetical protein